MKLIFIAAAFVCVSLVQDQWTQVPGGLKHVTASVNYIWGVNNNNHIFICDNPCNGNWRQIPGALKQIDAGDMEVWGVNSVDDIYKRPVD